MVKRFISIVDFHSSQHFSSFKDPFSVKYRKLDRDRRFRVHYVENIINDLTRKVYPYLSAFQSPLQAYRGYHRSVRFFQKVTGPFILSNILKVSMIPSKLRYDYLEYDKPEYRSSHPISYDSSVTRYAGVFPANVWFRPASIRPRKCDVPEAIELDEETRIKLNNSSVVSGSWTTGNHHASRYLTDGPKQLGFEAWMDAVQASFEVMPRFCAEMPIRSDMKYCNVKVTASPGPVSSLFAGNKGDCAPFSYQVAKWIWDKVNILEVGQFIDRAPYYPGGRARKHFLKWEPNKDVNDELRNYDPSTAYDSRLVQMPEFASQLVQMAWQSNFASYFHNSAFNKGTWVWLGQSMVHNGWKRLFPFYGKFCLEGDWEDFDVRVSRELIIIAFGVVFSYFADTVKSLRFISYCCMTFLNRLFIIPGGEMYYTSKGVPSGSVWTSDVDTIVNIIVWCKLILDDPFCKANNLHPRDFIGAFGGDDFLLGYPDGITSAPTWFFTRFSKTFLNWRIKGLKTGPMVNELDDDKSLAFYKTGLNYLLLPVTRVEEIIKRVILPEKKPRSTWNKWYAQSIGLPAPGKAREAFFSTVFKASFYAREGVSAAVPDIANLRVVDGMDMMMLRFEADRYFKEVVCSDVDINGGLSASSSVDKKKIVDIILEQGQGFYSPLNLLTAKAYIGLLYAVENAPVYDILYPLNVYCQAALRRKVSKKARRSRVKYAARSKLITEELTVLSTVRDFCALYGR